MDRPGPRLPVHPQAVRGDRRIVERPVGFQIEVAARHHDRRGGREGGVELVRLDLLIFAGENVAEFNVKIVEKKLVQYQAIKKPKVSELDIPS